MLTIERSQTQSQAGWHNFCAHRLSDGTNCGIQTWQRAADVGRVPIPRFESEHGDTRHKHREVN